MTTATKAAAKPAARPTKKVAPAKAPAKKVAPTKKVGVKVERDAARDRAVASQFVDALASYRLAKVDLAKLAVTVGLPAGIAWRATTTGRVNAEELRLLADAARGHARRDLEARETDYKAGDAILEQLVKSSAS